MTLADAQEIYGEYRRVANPAFLNALSIPALNRPEGTTSGLVDPDESDVT